MTEEDSIREAAGAVEWVVTTQDGACEHQDYCPRSPRSVTEDIVDNTRELTFHQSWPMLLANT